MAEKKSVSTTLKATKQRQGGEMITKNFGKKKKDSEKKN